MSLQAKYLKDGILELTDFSEGGGPLIRCHPDGRVELYEVPQYGGMERFEGDFPNVCAALAEASTWA